MASNKTLLNIHAKKYIQAVFEERLREEGFRCPDEKLLCWYRMRSDALYDTIVFRSSWPNVPLNIEILYEVSPLFFDPLRIPNVHYNDSTHMRLDCRKRISNRESGPINEMTFTAFAPDIPVFAPLHGGRGIYAFDEIILPEINRINTIEECYQAHKAAQYRKKDGSIGFISISREFVAEAVYMDDTEMYPVCRDKVLFALAMYEKLVENKPNKKELPLILEDWDQLYDALFEDGREVFLKSLGHRMEKNGKLLTKWGVIPHKMNLPYKEA